MTLMISINNSAVAVPAARHGIDAIGSGTVASHDTCNAKKYRKLKVKMWKRTEVD